MARWFRVYEELLDDPKIQRLPPARVKLLLNLWCLSAIHNGRLPPVSDIAFRLRMRRDHAMEAINFFRKEGLIDEDLQGLKPHNWDGRQFQGDSSTERSRRYRSKKRNGDATLHATPPDSDSDTDTDTECASHTRRVRASDEAVKKFRWQKAEEAKQAEEARQANPAGWPQGYRDQFDAEYPHKVGMSVALIILDGIKVSGKVKWSELMAALDVYKNKTDTRQWANPRTWLTEERWNDRPASKPNGHHGNVERSAEVAAIAARIEGRQSVQAVGGPPISVGGRELGGDHAAVISRNG